MKLKENFKPSEKPTNTLGWVSRLAIVIFGFFFFLLSIGLMGASFSSLGQGVAESILDVTANPFIGLFIGLLMTAVIQSSSTSTSMIVAVVATGSISLESAVPMIMGANIGTTLTSTIVSLGYITRKKEFRRAIAAGTMHDFYNILLTIIMFPLEFYYGFLSRSCSYITRFFKASENGNDTNFSFDFFVSTPFSQFVLDKVGNPWVVLLISFVVLFSSLKILSNIISSLLMGNSKESFDVTLFNSQGSAFAWGTLVTAAVQSSSVTTSLIVPLVATGKVSLKKSFHFILGANLGTTITALLASLVKSEAALSIAIAHMLFNGIGVLIFLFLPFLRRIPIYLSLGLGKLTMRYRIIGFSYIIFTFFLLPFTLIYFNKDAEKKAYVSQKQEKKWSLSEKTNPQPLKP